MKSLELPVAFCVLVSGLVLISSALFGQSPGWQLRVSGGPNFTILYGDHPIIEGSSPRIRFFGGINARTPNYGILHFQTGLFFDRRASDLSEESIRSSGGVFDENFFPTDEPLSKARVSMDYLVIPLLLGLHFGDGVEWSIQLGPTVSVLVGEDLFAQLENGQEGSFEFVEIDDGNLGMLASIGVQIPLHAQWKLSVEAQNNFGQSLIKSPGLSVSRFSIRTNTFGLALGLTYAFFR